ncbi:capsid maturation protease [Mycobacterium phage Pharaoh]|uniref:Capsid maturation protease n=1 Tax=Mycobacterium phage Pharaoh TaxID=2530140 RepID=A0A481W1L9_9CAUD|nr:capsid maturation protease [Mycobacterium phage Pharaoh]QBJ00203.1 capsid maturation protease [Mycobacterium phage Pharaoh]
MTPEQYATAQYAITAGLAAYVQRFASLFTGPVLTSAEWVKLLATLFPEVERRYSESAALGRTFYDSQRERHHPGLDRNERLQSSLKFEWFVQNMQPARRGMSQADSPNAAVTRLALSVVREVEMAGRRQIIGAVKNDPERIVQGWARVATGRETCAWCLMLISRGPEYIDARGAGINLDNQTVLDLWDEAGWDPEKFREDTKDEVEQWHAGCDCLAFPVFDRNNWPGLVAQKRALQLWIDAGKEASKLIDSGKARSENMNRETLNALRRRLDSGEISIPSYALAA